MNKVRKFDDLAAILQGIRAAGKKIVLCHGCFDLMHPGHIRHFQMARQMGDVLVVTVTPDRFVNKGPGRPVYDEDLRAESIAALECVDFVAVNKWPDPVETIKTLRPDIYVKGQEYEADENKKTDEGKADLFLQSLLSFSNELLSGKLLFEKSLSEKKPLSEVERS